MGTEALHSGALSFGALRADLIGQGQPISTPFGVRRVTYADNIASGRALGSIEERMRQLVLPLYANTHTEDSATGAHTSALMQQASSYIKSQLGADSTCKLVFCGSGSTAAIKRLQEILGLSAAASQREALLAALPAEQRPVVFVGPYEHHSNEISWRESLAEVIEIPLCDQGGIDLEALHQGLKAHAGRPLIGSFSAASNVTGRLTDTRSVARLLHAHGAYAFFDFAASAPYVHIDMKPGHSDGYDAVFLSPHKFVGGPGTPGVLCFQQQLYQQGSPSTAGGGTVRYVSRTQHVFYDDIEVREDAGTPAILGKIRTALAFHVKQRLGIDNIERREAELSRQALSRLSQHPQIEVLGNLYAPRLAVLSFLLRSGPQEQASYLHPRLVVRLLNDLFGIQSRGGWSCAGPYGHWLLNMDDVQERQYFECVVSGLSSLRPGWTRLNLAPWMSEAEVEFILSAIEFVAEHGARFLPLYDFNWERGLWTHASGQATPDLFGPLPDQAPQTGASYNIQSRSSQSHSSQSPTDEISCGEIPYADYLAQAQQLAASLPAYTPRPRPAHVPDELVNFVY